MKATELRGVLRYVKDFKDKVVVLSLDGGVVNHSNFSNLMVDIAVMRSLNIKVAIAHGAAGEMESIASQENVQLSDLFGNGVTDQPTLEIARRASNKISQLILEGLASVDLKGAIPNGLEAHPLGILKGIDHQFSGKIENIDGDFFQSLLDHNIIPIVPCVVGNGDQSFYRVNSDQACTALASKLKAIKIVFLTQCDGLEMNGNLIRQVSSSELEKTLSQSGGDSVSESLLSKLRAAARACRSGISRVHVINGTRDGDLLNEMFSTEGVGTLIYSNEFDDIRQARIEDIRGLLSLTQSGVDNEELIHRSKNDLESHIDEYFIFWSGNQIVGCVALHVFAESKQGELAYLFVHPDFENQGIGRKLVRFVENKARDAHLNSLFALSTQTFSFFVQKSGFKEGAAELLPEGRRDIYFASGRKSKILVKNIK